MLYKSSRKLKLACRVSSLLMVLITVSILLSGCEGDTVIVPQDILDKARAAKARYNVYYMESKMVFMEKGRKDDISFSRQWNYRDIKQRIELRTPSTKRREYMIVNSGKLYSYSSDKKEYLISNISNANSSINGDVEENPEKNFLDIYDSVKNIYDIKSIKRETLGNFDTYHLKLKANSHYLADSISDWWIERNSYMIVKERFKNKNYSSEITVTKLVFNPKLDMDIFKVSIPKNAKVKRDETKRESISIREASDYLKKNLLYYPGKKVLHLGKVLKESYGEGKNEGCSISQEYYKNNARVMSIDIDVGNVGYNDEKILKQVGAKKVIVRKKTAWYQDNGASKTVFWEEEGIRYSAIIYDPEITLNEFKKIALKMKYSDI